MSEGTIGPRGENPVRPLVARRLSGRGTWVFAGVAAVGAVLLFSTLEARRAERAAAPLRPVQVQGDGMIAPPPPLAIPEPAQEPSYPFRPYGGGAATQVAGIPQAPVTAAAQTPRLAARAPGQGYAPPAPAPYYGPIAAAPAAPIGPATVYQAPPAPPAALAQSAAQAGQRVKADRFANPSLTIPQGAVIQAVLETALDSTRAGPVRAVVSRDVRSFDGSRVLIPRGSRLYGEYKADLSTGQNRAMIQWIRLMRPDGVIIALDSPSADPLGRAGVTGKVNTHFFARFGGALLDTTLNLGLSLATRNVSGGTVILGMPGSTQSVTAPQSETVRPTVKVAQGTQVSVFVARDLDFSEVER